MTAVLLIAFFFLHIYPLEILSFMEAPYMNAFLTQNRLIAEHIELPFEFFFGIHIYGKLSKL